MSDNLSADLTHLYHLRYWASDTMELKTMNKSALLYLKAALLSFKPFKQLLLLPFNVRELREERPSRREKLVEDVALVSFYSHLGQIGLEMTSNWVHLSSISEARPCSDWGEGSWISCLSRLAPSHLLHDISIL